MSYVGKRGHHCRSVRRTKRTYDSASKTMVSLVLALVHCGEVLRGRPCTTTKFGLCAVDRQSSLKVTAHYYNNYYSLHVLVKEHSCSAFIRVWCRDRR